MPLTGCNEWVLQQTISPVCNYWGAAEHKSKQDLWPDVANKGILA